MAVYNNYIPQDMIRVEDLLKQEYLPFVNNALNVEADPFLEMIKKEKLSADEIQFGVRIGIGGGFGMSEERQPTPNAVAPLYDKFRAKSKDAYVDLKISEKTFRLGRSNAAIMKDAVTDETEASYDAAKWNVGRMLFGDGTGLLANATAAVATNSNELTVDDTSKLIEGLVIDLYAPTASTISSGNAAIQIISIDHVNKKVLLSQNPGTALSVASDGVYAKLYVQNSRNREITGLGKIFAPASSTSTDIGYEIYGITKSNNAVVNPYVVDASHDISDVVITDAIRLGARRQGKIDMVLAGGDAYNAYEYYMRESGINTNIVEKRKFISGAAGYDIMFGDRIATLVRNDFVPADEMWLVDTTKFTLKETGWDFCVQQNGSIFTLMTDTSVYRALLANYLELICNAPGSCVRITNANAST